MNSYEKIQIEQIRCRIERDKLFRAWAEKRCLEIKETSENEQERNICIFLLKYIYDLELKEILTEKHKK